MNPQFHGSKVAGISGTSDGTLGWWSGSAPRVDDATVNAFFTALGRSFFVLAGADASLAVGEGGTLSADHPGGEAWPVMAWVPPGPVESLGDRSFCKDYTLQFPCLAGAMAHGIGSEALVEAMGREGMLGFFGAAGLTPDRVDAAIERLRTRGAGREFPYGFNLIHSPNEPELEAAIVDLYLRRDIPLVEASAYLDLTLPLVRYRVRGIDRDAKGKIRAPNRVIAKVSRTEVARKFFSPPPERFLAELVRREELTPEQAGWARQIPMAEDLTAEADSGGHTDNRPAVALLPTMIALREQMQREFDYSMPLRVGSGGGVATPYAAAAAFAMGAAYVLTGSVNQACVEAGTSATVKTMLAEAEQADIAMAPAADMFEMGVKVQVLKRGTMFPMRATKLYELYRNHESLDAIPPRDRSTLEKSFFRTSFEEVWNQTAEYFLARDPRQVDRAHREPKHKMALVFRWYLGQTSLWANDGEPSRQIDYQIWCGPAMPAFNEWARGSFLEDPQGRRVVTVAMNILYGAAFLRRLEGLRGQGVELPSPLRNLRPRRMHELKELLNPVSS